MHTLIIGHCGHELRVLKFIEIFRPQVFILTDGSGSSGVSREARSRKVIEDYGGELKKCFCTDKEIYDIILNQDMREIEGIKYMLNIFTNKYDLFFGDSAEGFNPTHDLCRYLINFIAGKQNYSFDLDALPRPANITINLTEEDKQRREEVIKNYPEIQKEVDMAKAKFGADAFNIESLKIVTDFSMKENPYYETYGKKQIEAGVYREIITHSHMKNIYDKLK